MHNDPLLAVRKSVWKQTTVRGCSPLTIADNARSDVDAPKELRLNKSSICAIEVRVALGLEIVRVSGDGYGRRDVGDFHMAWTK